MEPSPLAFIILGAFFFFFVLMVAVARRYRKAGPNEALIVSGGRHMTVDPVTGQRTGTGVRIVKAGGAFVFPLFERLDRLSLEVIPVQLEVPEVQIEQGTTVTVSGVAQVKVKGDDASILAAAEHFLSKSPRDVGNVVHELLESHLRTICETTTLDAVRESPVALSRRLADASETKMAEMGLEVISLTIKKVR